MYIIPLHPEDALKKWDVISDILKPAMAFEDGKYTLADVRDLVAEGIAHTWVAIDGGTIFGAAITQVMCYPQKSMLLVLCLAGKQFQLWDNIVRDFLVPYAKRVNCRGIEFMGRKGWVKRAAKLGFRPVHYVYELSITDDNLDDSRR